MSLVVFLILFFVQALIAIVVVVVLKRLLDKELMEAALESMEFYKVAGEVKAVNVRCVAALKSQLQERVEGMCRRRFTQAHWRVVEDATLKGGVVIHLNSHVLDFSLDGRLKECWSS